MLVPGPAVPPQMRLPPLPVLKARDRMVSVRYCPPPGWTLQQLGQYRRQVHVPGSLASTRFAQSHTTAGLRADAVYPCILLCLSSSVAQLT